MINPNQNYNLNNEYNRMVINNGVVQSDINTQQNILVNQKNGMSMNGNSKGDLHRNYASSVNASNVNANSNQQIGSLGGVNSGPHIDYRQFNNNPIQTNGQPRPLTVNGNSFGPSNGVNVQSMNGYHQPNINPLVSNMQQISLKDPPVINNNIPPFQVQSPQIQNKPAVRPMYPQKPTQQYPSTQPQSDLQYQTGSVTQLGFNKLWGHPDSLDLLQERHILPPEGYTPPKVSLQNQLSDAVNCDPNIFRCTVTKIPESNSLLQKSRLPFGVLIHPFRDLTNLPVVSCSQIVRCRACRTYINPFVFFVDSKKWKCNLCYRVNELPEEFQYDPVSKTYGDVTRRPEVRSSTIEFIAPSEYMLRPPPPAIYLFLLDVSCLAVQSGYLNLMCNTLAEQLDKLPGDARTQIGFIAYNSQVHFYSIGEGFSRPQEITIIELDDIFMPQPDNLLINLKLNRDLINDLLEILPKRFENSHDSGSALGAALQVAYKMMSATGGRVTVFQSCLPNKGPGGLQPRENPNNRSSKDVQHLGPANDFYKRLALEYSGQQIAVDLFLLNGQYSDLATISGISKFSGGTVYHIPLFNYAKQEDSLMFKRTLERYLTRKIGFEAVMRVRCTRGLVIHTFHGNFFVRSTDLLSLPNVNPDASYGMQISYDESLQDVSSVCFQAALLYTSSQGERRIRVHTLCVPVTNSLSEIMYSADSQCIVGLLSKMAVDRSIQSTMSDARDAFINATIDIFSAYKLSQNLPQTTAGQLTISRNLSLLPLYILALLKNLAFRTGTSTRLDDRVYAMCELKTLPLDQLIKFIYPDFYHIDSLFMPFEQQVDKSKVFPPKRHLSAEFLDSRSIYLLDTGTKIILYVGSNVDPHMLKSIIGVQTINEIPDLCFDLQMLGTHENEVLHSFIDQLNEDKPFTSIIQIIRDTSASRKVFIDALVDDHSDSSLSYYEFLQHIRSQVK